MREISFTKRKKSMRCSSCGKTALNGIKLPCPSCSNEIIRCAKCRSLSIEYKCEKCGHKGP